MIGAPKFHFADVGVVNHLARRGELHRGSELYGKAFENWVFHELRAHNAYSEVFATLSHWRCAQDGHTRFPRLPRRAMRAGDMRPALRAPA